MSRTYIYRYDTQNIFSPYTVIQALIKSCMYTLLDKFTCLYLSIYGRRIVNIYIISSHQFNVAKLQVFSIRMKHCVNKQVNTQVSIFTEHETHLFVVAEAILILLKKIRLEQVFLSRNLNNINIFFPNIFNERTSLFSSVILSRLISAFSFHFLSISFSSIQMFDFNLVMYFVDKSLSLTFFWGGGEFMIYYFIYFAKMWRPLDDP